MKKTLYISSLMILLVLSCSKMEKGQTYTFSIDGVLDEMPVGGEQETKVTLAHTMQMTWAKGDAVSVVNLTKGNALGGTLTADQALTRSTFSGTITGTIDNGDKLALIYPNLGYTQEQPFTNATIDFSAQDGSDKNTKFCVVALITANTSGGNIVEADTRFYFKSGIINITLADLPVSTVINTINIPDFYSGIALSINSSKDDITTTGITGPIVITPNSSSNKQGTKGLYFGMGGAPKVASNRTVSVICGGNTYESQMTGSAIGAKFYTLSVGAFELKQANNGFSFNYDNTEMGDGGTVVINGEE